VSRRGSAPFAKKSGNTFRHADKLGQRWRRWRLDISTHTASTSHVVNYVQWTNREKLEAAHHCPEFRKKWPRFGELIKEAEPCLYQIAHVEAA
jgi:hypothetical protein